MDVKDGLMMTSVDPSGIIMKNASGTDTIIIDGSNGKLGIGTSNPDSMLHLKSSGDVVLKLEADDDNRDESHNPTIILTQDEGARTGFIGLAEGANQPFTNALSNGLYLNTNGQSDDEGFQIAVGDVHRLTFLKNPAKGGINIHDPRFDFQVHNDGNNCEFFVSNGTATASAGRDEKLHGVGLISRSYDGGNGAGILEFREAYTSAGENINYGFHVAYNGHANNHIQNYNANTFVISKFNNSTTPSICIGIPRSSGYVGFGIQDPSTRIEVATQETDVTINADMHSDGTFIYGGNTNGDGSLHSHTQIRMNDYINTISDGPYHLFESADYNPEDYNEGAGGASGTPASRLRSCAHFGSSISIEGGVYLESDRRIKHDIQPIDISSCLTAINNIPLYKYKYNNHITRSNKPSYGFMAQDVEKVLPLVVNKKNDYLPCIMEYANDISWEQVKVYDEEKECDVDWWKLHIPVLMRDASGNARDFDVGTEFKFYLTDDYKHIDGSQPYKSTLMEGNKFLLKDKAQYCFIVGYKTDDFLTLEKERLFTIYHGAIQELSRKNDRLEAENVAKTTEIAELKNEISLIKQHLGI